MNPVATADDSQRRDEVEFGATADQADGLTLIDVRRSQAFNQSDWTIPDARWRDPATVDHWAPECAGLGPVIVYCVHGHEVSRNVARRLRQAGLDARFLIGGIEGWRAGGRPLASKGMRDTP